MKHWKALLPLTGGDHWLPIHVRHSSQKQSSFLHKDVPEKGTSREKVTPGSRFYTTKSLWVVVSLSTIYFKTVAWSLTRQTNNHLERNVVFNWAGVCGEWQNRSTPKNAIFTLILCGMKFLRVLFFAIFPAICTCKK